jgi:hypothetical protein
MFETETQLSMITSDAFRGSGLTSILIPSSVVLLGSGSFAECTSLQSVVFESGSRLSRIDNGAFYESKLRSITVPSSVVEIGDSAFQYCTLLESVIFESGSRLSAISSYPFAWTPLSSIMIQPNLDFIDGSAFRGLRSKSLSLSGDNPRIRVVDSFLEGQCGSIIYRYLGCCASVVIPSSVVVLGRSSVLDCKSLESVIFESGSQLSRIEYSAFYGSGLKSITIPSSVVVLGKDCFGRCWSLKSVAFESGSQLSRIEDFAFRECQLESIVIPPKTDFIDGSAFHDVPAGAVSISEDSQRFRIRESVIGDLMCSAFYCSLDRSLESIVIPSSVVILGKRLFCECKYLYSVTFESGSRLRRIEEETFRRCEFESMELPPNVDFIDASAFLLSYGRVSTSKDNSHFRTVGSLLEDFGGSVIYHRFGFDRSISIPSSVVVLGKMSFAGSAILQSVAFESCSQLSEIQESAFLETGLTSIVIPSSVIVLGKMSSAGCPRLESVTFESGSQLSRIGELAFSRSGLRSIVIPSSVVVLGKECFATCTSLESVLFESCSRLSEIEESTFEWSPLDFREIVRDLAASRSVSQPLAADLPCS